MASSVIGALRVDLGLDSASFIKGTKNAQGAMRKMSDNMMAIGAKMSVAITASFIAMGKVAIDGALAQRQAMAQVESALASMGNAAGKTSDELAKTADALELKSLFDADVILTKVTANLLTFGNVSGEAFDRAQQAALDMSQRLGQDLQSSAVQLGKALNDPLKGITALSRVGVQFTEEQKAMIAAMVEAGNVAGAQGIILSEVERQFAGAAAAAAANSPYRELQVVMGQLGDVVGEALLPFVTKLASFLTDLAKRFTALSPATQNTIVAVAAVAAAIGPTLIVIGSMASGLSALAALGAPLAAAFGVIKAAALLLMANPVILGFAAVVTGIYLVWQNWDRIEPILRNLYNGVKKWIGDNLARILKGVLNPIGAVTEGFRDMYIAVVGNSYVPDMVDGIAAEMARLDSVMVQPVVAATDKAKKAFEDMATRGLAVMQRLFPEEVASSNSTQDERAIRGLLDAGKISEQTFMETMRRLRAESTATMRSFKEDLTLQTESIPLLFADPIKGFKDVLGDLGKQSKTTTVQVAESFRDMADKTMQSISQVANAVKSGGFLGILQSVIGLGLQLGSIGAFGKTIQTNINAPRIPSADGGGYTGNGSRSGGMDGKGGFLAMLHPRETVLDHTRGQGGGGSTIQVVPSPFFNVVVDGRIQTAAPGIAQSGAQEAGVKSSRMQSRRVR